MSAPLPPVVFCCICGEPWEATDPGVQYRSLDRRWWCTDETSCTSRRARGEAVMTAEQETAMLRALDEVWAELEARGWKLP